MTTRITDRHLKATVDRINRVTKSPEHSYTRTETGHRANVGNYHLDYAYDGVQLVRMACESGSIHVVLATGYTTKRACYEAMQSFIAGLEAQA
jgi:hypothetical protein